MECLICSDPIQHARLGINACRPCAAFYKRTIGQEGTLKCKSDGNNCREKNTKKSCRKCRLSRFIEVLANAREATPLCEDKIVQKIAPANCLLTESATFVDHNSFYECEPTTSKTPMLDKIRKGYSLMCIIRKTGEMALKTEINGANDLKVDDMTFTPATHDMIFAYTRIGMHAIVEYANLAFDEFRLLEEDYKKKIVETSYALMKILDSAYRLCHLFPGDMTMTLPGYTTYTRDTHFDIFLANCPENMDKPTLIEEMKKSRGHLAAIVRKFFERTKPTDIEFLTLFGLALWNDKVLDRNENLMQVANDIRSEIMRELHCHYATEEIPDYASRVGNIFCLLANCQIQSVKAVEDYRVYRLLNMFDNEFDDECHKKND